MAGSGKFRSLSGARQVDHAGRAASGAPSRDRPALGADDPLPPDHDRVAPAPRPNCLTGLYRDHRSRLRRFFLGRASPADADDLVQETFVRLASTAERSPRAIERPQAYVNRIAVNLVREQARFAARRSAALHVGEDEVELAGSDPVAMLEARDMLARLEAAMAKMKPTTREIFMAHRLDGCTYREIADRTGYSVKGVEKHIGKAILVVNRALRGR